MNVCSDTQMLGLRLRPQDKGKAEQAGCWAASWRWAEVGSEDWEDLERLGGKEKEFLTGAQQGHGDKDRSDDLPRLFLAPRPVQVC